MDAITPTLHMLCGRIASGKSTLASELGRQNRTVLLSEDDWLSGLYGDQMTTIADYVRCTARLQAVIGPHVAALLNAGVSVVLDFQANTREARSWMRGILEQTNAAHVLHVLDVPEGICLERLRARNASGTHPFKVTDAQFHQVSRHFALPTEDEGLEVRVHQSNLNHSNDS
jgi:predicted kinase